MGFKGGFKLICLNTEKSVYFSECWEPRIQKTKKETRTKAFPHDSGEGVSLKADGRGLTSAREPNSKTSLFFKR